jgi:ATP-dependent helicase Lhr and Lhr-like helicase
VFRKYDPENLLLSQSQQEVLSQELDVERLRETLLQLQNKRLQLQKIKRPTPFAFPLLVERLRESSSSEKLADRITRMVADLEKAAGAGGYESAEDVGERSRFSAAEPKRIPRLRAGKDGRPRTRATRVRQDL